MAIPSNSPLQPSMHHVHACAAAKLVVCTACVASWQDAKMTQYYIVLEFMLGNSGTKLPAQCMLGRRGEFEGLADWLSLWSYSTTCRTLLNFKVISQRSRSRVFFLCAWRCRGRLVGARRLSVRVPCRIPTVHRSVAGVGLQKYSQQK